MTFIADERFQSFYVENNGVWTLQIKYVQARDAGIYECQVSTEPKISARVHLHVVGKYEPTPFRQSVGVGPLEVGHMPSN